MRPMRLSTREWESALHGEAVEDARLMATLRAWHHNEHAAAISGDTSGIGWSLWSSVFGKSKISMGKYQDLLIERAHDYAKADGGRLYLKKKDLKKAASSMRSEYVYKGKRPGVKRTLTVNNVSVVLGTDDMEIARQGGSSELGAMRRQASPFYFPSFAVVGGALPQPMYRAAVWQRAHKLARGGTPGVKEIFIAQKTVDKDLKRRGVGISIPGARPGRRTVR